jgi:hypothetical protein
MSLLVSGGFHQADERFTDESRGKQCAFITLSALLTAQNTPVTEWNSATIDNVDSGRVLLTSIFFDQLLLQNTSNRHKLNSI